MDVCCMLDCLGNVCRDVFASVFGCSVEALCAHAKFRPSLRQGGTFKIVAIRYCSNRTMGA